MYSDVKFMYLKQHLLIEGINEIQLFELCEKAKIKT